MGDFASWNRVSNPGTTASSTDTDGTATNVWNCQSGLPACEAERSEYFANVLKHPVYIYIYRAQPACGSDFNFGLHKTVERMQWVRIVQSWDSFQISKEASNTHMHKPHSCSCKLVKYWESVYGGTNLPETNKYMASWEAWLGHLSDEDTSVTFLNPHKLQISAMH